MLHDDAKFYKTVYDIHDCLKLQLDLNSIELSIKSWKLSKYIQMLHNILHLKQLPDFIWLGPLYIKLYAQKLLKVAVLKDLGITM